MRGGVSAPLATVLASTSFGPTAPCPSCHRPSRLSELDGGDCLTCGLRKAAARELGEALWSASTDNAGIGWYPARPLRGVS